MAPVKELLDLLSVGRSGGVRRLEDMAARRQDQNKVNERTRNRMNKDDTEMNKK